MRDRLWKWARSKYPEGAMLPGWLMVLRAVLYPLHFLRCQLGETCGYRYRDDTWNIHGLRYTDRALRALAEAQGETYRITRTGDCVALERVAQQQGNSDGD